MTAYGGQEPNSSRTAPNDPSATGTTAGADVTARMAGTHEHETVVHPTETRGVRRAKTSAAAVFALIFGLSALICALTAILSPVAVLLGITAIIVGIAGIKMARRPGVTGKGVAITGLVMGLLGLLLGGAVIAGASVLVNDERRLDQIQTQIDNLRAKLPSQSEVQSQIPG